MARNSGEQEQKKPGYEEVKKKNRKWISIFFFQSLASYAAVLVLTFFGLLIVYKWNGAIYFIGELTPFVLFPVIMLILTLIMVGQYEIILHTKEQNNNLWKGLLIFLSIIIACFIWFFSFTGIVEVFNIKLPSVYASTPTYTDTFTPLPSIPTDTYTPTITLTPTPASIDQLNWCGPSVNFPCKYRLQDGDYSIRVADSLYHNESYAGRISELFRDENGNVRGYQTNVVIVIPDIDEAQDEKYYEYYFQLMPHPINKCEGEVFSFPCWYISQGETYNGLIKYYPNPYGFDVQCIKDANKVIYIPGGLDYIIPKVGVILVLPVCH